MIQMDPAKHTVLEPSDALLTIRRQLNSEDVFMYHHRLRDVLVIAVWVEKGGMPGYGKADELHVLKDGQWPTRELVKSWNRDPVEVLKFLEQIEAQEEYDERVKAEANDMERIEVARHLRRKGYADAADGLEIGGRPFCGSAYDTDEDAEIKLDMTNKAKGRIISTPGGPCA